MRRLLRLGWLGAALKRLRDERFAAVGLALLVLVTGFVFGIAPRALDALGDRVLRDEVRSATLFARNIQFVEEARITAGAENDDPMVEVVERGQALTGRLPASVRALVGDGGWQVESGRHQLYQESDPMFVRFRFQEGIDDRIRYVGGRAPGDVTREMDDVFVDGVEVDGLVVFEAALARPTADAFGIAVGDTVVVYGDGSDPLMGRGPELEYRAFELTGTYDVIDPDDPWWLGDRLLQHPVVRSQANLDVRYLDGAALLAPSAYRAFIRSGAAAHSPLRYTWRRLVDPERFDATTVGPLLVDLRRAQSEFPSANPTPAYETGYRTGLVALVEAQVARWASAVAILTVVAVGPAAVAAAALALVALLAAQRRRAALAISRSRGASVPQLVAAVLTEAVVLTVPPVALAVLVARLLIPGGPNSPTTIAAIATALLTTVILVATSVPSASDATDAARGGRDTGIVRRPTARRLVAETLLVALALGGAWLLRERGVHGVSTAGRLSTADPLIAAVPALVGLGAGVLAVRIFPLPMRLLAWLAATRRDLVPVLAMRRATSGAGGGPILVVLLAIASIGAFSSAALVHLERAADVVAWQEIGAAYRIHPGAGSLPGTLDATTLPGAEAASEVFQASVMVGVSGPRLELLVVDPESFERVVAGTPADPDLPAELLTPGDGIREIPALVATSLSERPDGVSPGEAFDLSVQGYTLTYRAAYVRDSFPGVAPGSHFAIVSRRHVNAIAPAARLDPTQALVRAPDERSAELRAAVLQIVEGGRVESRGERTAGLRNSPVVRAVQGGIAAGAVVAAIYAALGVAAALALSGLARSVEVAHLRTLGLTRRQAFGLVAVEHGPTIVAAFAAGAALGLVLFLLLRPGLGLSALVGSAIEVPLTVEAGQLALVLLAVAAIVMLGLAAGAVLQRAAAPMAAIRRGFE